MIERMEADLVEKAVAAYANVPDIHASVHGVFSLDHLETMLASDLCGGIGAGVGYLEATPHLKVEPNGSNDRGNSAVMILYRFVVVLAVPTEEACGTRHNATQLLTVLRSGILGKPIKNDHTNRTWSFVSEKPEISASTKQMLYYAQVWQVALPNRGN
jgi:hypothetical protein